jgi:hypothetical protein
LTERTSGKIFGDYFGRLHGGLAQMSVLDDLALDPRSLTFQRSAHGLQLGDQPVNVLHRGSGDALKQ